MQAQTDLVQGNMSEHRLGDRHVEPNPEVGVEPIGDAQVRKRQLGPLLGRELMVVASANEVVVDVDAVVVALAEVVDQVAAGPKAAAPYVEKTVLGL